MDPFYFRLLVAVAVSATLLVLIYRGDRLWNALVASVSGLGKRSAPTAHEDCHVTFARICGELEAFLEAHGGDKSLVPWGEISKLHKGEPKK